MMIIQNLMVAVATKLHSAALRIYGFPICILNNVCLVIISKIIEKHKNLKSYGNDLASQIADWDDCFQLVVILYKVSDVVLRHKDK